MCPACVAFAIILTTGVTTTGGIAAYSLKQKKNLISKTDQKNKLPHN